MDKRTLKALHGSVRKWIKIATWKGADHGTDNCPLCEEFYGGPENCLACPVRMKTQEYFCGGSPYKSFCRACIEEGGLGGDASVVVGPKSQCAAEKMALFLIDLLPEEERARYYE